MKTKFKLELLHEITDVDNDNIDAIVHLDDERSYGITFFTIANISTLVEKWRNSGECLNGAYFWGVDCVIVKKLEPVLLEQIVADMLDRDEHVFEKHFTRMTKPFGEYHKHRGKCQGEQTWI